jgi:N-methylhydantoinase B
LSEQAPSVADADAGVSGSDTEFDPVTFSVILNRFNSIAEEMTITMEKTAYTSILALARDYSCAIYDQAARQVCMFDAVPVHTTSMHLVIEETARTFADNIHEGDIFLVNHPYRGNTHVADLVTAVPVFHGGEHLFWSVTKGHQQDCGAFVPASIPVMAQNVWQEGLQIPPIKIAERGELRDDLIDLYLANVRYPELLHGDLLAQLASIETGRRRLIELVDEYGTEAVKFYVDEAIAYADRRMSAALREIPDGTYKAETWVDSDGATALDIPIKVAVTVSDDQVHVDYSGSGPQSPTGQNGTVACLHAAAGIPFMYYIDPDVPKNHGCISHVHASAPEGTICNARFPASTATATVTPANAMHSVVNQAMVEAIPERVAAGGARTNNQPDFVGVDPDTGEPWAALLLNNSGGQGASKETDGWPLWGSENAMGAMKAQPIEQLELLYPLLIEMMEIEEDSMGCGEWIGGPGNRVVVVPTRGTVTCGGFADGYRNPPHGALGGHPGVGGGQYVENRRTQKRTFISGTGHIRASADEEEVWIGVSSGGGGYGRPEQRDPEQVSRDVRDGIISREAAREVCGVALSDDLEPEIDHATTARLREALAGEVRPNVDPQEPGAATWLSRNKGEQDEYLLNPTEYE